MEYLPHYEIALCVPCQVAVPLDDIDSHVTTSHIGIRSSARREILSYFENLPVARNFGDIQTLPDGSPPLRFLQAPHPEFFCPKCLTYKPYNWRVLGTYLRKVQHQKRCCDRWVEI